MQQWLPTALGVAAGACSVVSFVPQLIKALRDPDTHGISLRMYIITVTGFALWTLYGGVLESWPLLASNGVSLLLSGAILVVKLKNIKRHHGAD